MAEKKPTEDNEESLEDSLVTPVTTPTPAKKRGLTKSDEKVLIAALGEQTAQRVMDEALVSVTKLDKTNRFEVTVDRNKSAHTLFYYDGDDLIMDGPLEKSATLSRLLHNSVSATGKYSASDMAIGVNRYLKGFLSIDTGRDRRSDQVRLGKELRELTKNLSDVFGFDDPRQLETFMAAWLMENATCRLSGIPGTGKTTAINCAASLLANSYGYDESLRYVKRKDGAIMLYEYGQNYEVYLNNLPDVRSAWNQWRFTDWEENSKISGSYAFGFEFLKKTFVGPDGISREKKEMTPSQFKRALFNADIIHEYDTGGKLANIKAKPNLVNSKTKTTATSKDKSGALYSVDYSKIITGSEEFETDAGGNQGYAFRKYLMENFYDSRLDEGDGEIMAEMLREIGVAKIDYDKRADEVLYGMDIQQITIDAPSGGKISTYAFEPIPRAIVTQPIKFFNEANRSQSGVEDAILGLIAEKTVEYRGKRFTSPNFVAWMDTNPHQKGNDLAFIDRIDTELFFTTVELGERYAQLAGAHGTHTAEAIADDPNLDPGIGKEPQARLAARMSLDKNAAYALTPYRFTELNNAWDFVKEIPFSPLNNKDLYDGLKDIATLSVLFTQRYFVRTPTTSVLGNESLEHTLYSTEDIHQSPLMDISKASNDLLLKDPQEDFATRYGGKEEDGPFQAPALFRRVLGFRFTKSLAKLSQALAFLRGKDYVSREEILDGLPYVVGHRLGPARAGEDSEGRTNGLVSNKAFGTLLNEQEMIREFIVHGYLLADTPSFLGPMTPRPDGTDQTMMGAWDAFTARCKENLMTCGNFVNFESDVLHPVKLACLGTPDGGVIEGYTPVHWHLAQAVVTDERKGLNHPPLVDYGEYKNYRVMYDRYLKLMDLPTEADLSTGVGTSGALKLDYSLHDYYSLRGRIARQPLLFTDDRSRLLKLVESRINTIAKGQYKDITAPPPLASRFAVATTTQFPDTGTQFRIEPSPLTFSLRTYGDALGAYGYLMSRGISTIAPESMSQSPSPRYNLDVQNWADQSMRLVGQYPYNGTDKSLNPTQTDLMRSRLFQQMANIEDIFGPTTGSGLQFHGDDESAYKTSANIGVFLAECKQTIVNAMNGDPVAYGMLSEGGGALLACYELEHAPHSRGAAELIRQGVKDPQNDKLRLWLRLRPLGNWLPDAKSVTFVFTLGITSNFLEGNKYDDVDGVIKEELGRLMSIADRSAVNLKNFGVDAGSSAKTGWDKKGMADAGNMTLEDLAYYQLLYHQVVMDE